MKYGPVKPHSSKGGDILHGFLFEQFVAELLAQLGFFDVQVVAGGPDMGIDIIAKYPTNTPTGDIATIRYAVQVKHGPQSRLTAKDIAQLTAMSQIKNADKVLLITSSNVTSAARDYISRFASNLRGDFEIWDRDILTRLSSEHLELQEKYKGLLAEFPLSAAMSVDSAHRTLIERLTHCPAGREGWREFEEVGAEILAAAFCPPLKRPRLQVQTMSGLERRDALFSLRAVPHNWQELRHEFDANFLLCEFKNYAEPFGKDEVNQTRNYLKKTVGRIGIIFSRKGPNDGAKKMRNSVYAEEKKVILFFDDHQLTELLRLKSARQDPLDLLQDAIDEFYISFE